MSFQSVENLITKQQLSEKLALSVSYINKLMAKGLPTAPTAGRAVRFRLSEVFVWLERNSYK